MKNYILFIFLFLSTFSFCQEITKKEFQKMINNSRKEYSKKKFSFDHKIIADNKDSIFYKSKSIIVYNSLLAKYNNKFCRTVEFKFYKNGKVNLIDCQSCKEPSSCYVTKEQNIYNYKLKQNEGKLFFELENKYSEMKFIIVMKKKIEFDNKIYNEILLEKI